MEIGLGTTNGSQTLPVLHNEKNNNPQHLYCNYLVCIERKIDQRGANKHKNICYNLKMLIVFQEALQKLRLLKSSTMWSA